MCDDCSQLREKARRLRELADLRAGQATSAQVLYGDAVARLADHELSHADPRASWGLWTL